MTNINLKDLSTDQLQRIISIRQQIEGLESELDSIAAGSTPHRGSPPGPGRPKGTPGKRKMSAAGRRAIALAAKKRWASYNAKKVSPAKPGKKKRTMNAAGRAKIAVAARARWAKAKAEGKTRL